MSVSFFLKHTVSLILIHTVLTRKIFEIQAISVRDAGGGRSAHAATENSIPDKKVQRRFTRMIPGLADIHYEERLKRLNLMTLDARRERADLLETFRTFKGMTKVDLSLFFSLNTNATRGHSLKLRKAHTRTKIRKNFFSQRIVNKWNALPPRSMESKTVNEFKGYLQRLYAHTQPQTPTQCDFDNPL